jgi:hypothetical protein
MCIRWISTAWSVAVALALLSFSSPALASSIPPGNAGADQYTEGIPGAGGNGTFNGVGGSEAPDERYGKLASLGDAGASAAAILAASSPQSAALERAMGDRKGGGRGIGANVDRPSGSDGGSLGSAVQAAVGGSDAGMGVGLPIVLALALAAAAVALLQRHRGGRDPSPH